MKIPAVFLENPQVLLRRLLRAAVILTLIITALSVIRHLRHKSQEAREKEKERTRMEAETLKNKVDINWEAQMRTIIPEEEELLAPTVIPQLLIPPLLNKIDVPKALSFERTKRYTAAYEFHSTPQVTFWNAPTPAAAAGDRTPRPRPIDLPAAIAPSLTVDTSAMRKPKPFQSVGQTYIFMP